MTREDLITIVEAEQRRAHDAVTDAYWRFTRCANVAPSAVTVPWAYELRKEMGRRLRQLRAGRWRPCGNADCAASSGIHEGLTFGRGELDDHGFWSIPCAPCAREHERRHPEDGACWPFATPKERTTNMSTNDIPRRIRIDLFTPAEKAIWDATQAVEAAGADVRLTRAVNKLAEARELVADFVDGVPAKDDAAQRSA